MQSHSVWAAILETRRSALGEDDDSPQLHVLTARARVGLAAAMQAQGETGSALADKRSVAP